MTSRSRSTLQTPVPSARRWVAVLLATCTGAAMPQPAGPSRGALLYDNHCVECHSTAMHWRDLRLAQDWSTLKWQVRRWQSTARLEWTEEDIDAVTRHLNDTIYRFPQPQGTAKAKGQRVPARP